MTLPRRRRIAWAVAICYVWASALAGVWHDHADHEVAGCVGEHAHQHADCDTAAHDEDGEPGAPASDDDCVVCRFVAQSAVQPPQAPLPLCGELMAEVRPHPSSATPQFFFSCGLARAPPVIG